MYGDFMCVESWSVFRTDELVGYGGSHRYYCSNELCGFVGLGIMNRGRFGGGDHGMDLKKRLKKFHFEFKGGMT